VPATERLQILDGLRGLAIALVVWYHVWLVSGLSAGAINFIAEAGFLGVDLFFFISGFCLFYPYAKALIDDRPMPTTGHFFMRRAAKILPSYLIALAVFAIVYRDRFASVPDAVVQVLSHLTFLHTFGAISGPLWTIGVEVQFYFLFPLIIIPFRKNPVLTYLAMAVVAECYRSVLTATHMDTTFFAFNQLPAYIDIFGAGMLASYAFVVVRKRDATLNRSTLTAISVVLVGIAVAGLAKVSAIDQSAGMDATYAWVNAHRFLIGPLCIAIAVSTAFSGRVWRATIAAPVLVFLSVISYNLYLWNLEIAVWLHDAGLSPGAAFALSIVSGLVVASAITYLIERPILEATGPRKLVYSSSGGLT
jgi:peptidoglycan/LPS O-acetylase OafA/YrhL